MMVSRCLPYLIRRIFYRTLVLLHDVEPYQLIDSIIVISATLGRCRARHRLP